MPSVSTDSALDFHIVGGHADSRPRLSEPLVYSGTLDGFEQNDITPVIGREYYGLQIRDLLAWDDQHIKDLAVTSESTIIEIPSGEMGSIPKSMPEITEN